MSRGPRVILATALTVLVGLAAACGSGGTSGSNGAKAPSSMSFYNIIKVSGNTWFENMDRGIVKFAAKTGVHVTQEGPPQATAEGQVSLIESLIPKRPTVIGIDPNSEQAVEGALARAKAAGIITVSQEAPSLASSDFDLEAFNNATYGAQMMDTLAACMGGKGQYASFVGNLTAASHMAWAAAELSEAKAKYPGITRVTGPVVTQEESSVAYQETKQLLATYPNIKGFLGSATTDVPGIAQAVTQAGLAGKVCIVGTSEPVLSKTYVDNGTVYAIYAWDASLTGQATMNAALMLAEGKKVGTGTNLGVPGYTDIQPCGAGATAQCYMGNAILKMTKQNIGNYDF